MSAYGLATKEEIKGGFASPGIVFPMDTEENYFNRIIMHFPIKFETSKFWKCTYERSWEMFRTPPVFRDKFIEKLSEMYPQYTFKQYEISGIWVEKKEGDSIYEQAQLLDSNAHDQFKYVSPDYNYVNKQIDAMVELRDKNKDNKLFVESINVFIKFICAKNFENIKLPSGIEPCPKGKNTTSWARNDE